VTGLQAEEDFLALGIEFRVAHKAQVMVLAQGIERGEAVIFWLWLAGLPGGGPAVEDAFCLLHGLLSLIGRCWCGRGRHGGTRRDREGCWSALRGLAGVSGFGPAAATGGEDEHGADKKSGESQEAKEGVTRGLPSPVREEVEGVCRNHDGEYPKHRVHDQRDTSTTEAQRRLGPVGFIIPFPAIVGREVFLPNGKTRMKTAAGGQISPEPRQCLSCSPATISETGGGSNVVAGRRGRGARERSSGRMGRVTASVGRWGQEPMDLIASLPGDIWQGGSIEEEEEYELVRLGISLVVNLAPDPPLSPGLAIEEIHYPIDDGPIRHIDMGKMLRIARAVSAHTSQGKHTLIHCQMGWNRSGLMTGLVLRDLGFQGDLAGFIRSRRADALCNVEFAEYLATLGVRK
jgi:hypothetical protein